MFAKISTATVAQFKLFDDEVAVLNAAYELIDSIQSTLDRGQTIINKDTSDRIAWGEFTRVKYVLSNLIEHNGVEWNVQQE